MATGDYIMLMSSRMFLLDENGIYKMLSYLDNKGDVGVIAPRVIYNSGEIQHGGIVINKDTIAGNLYFNQEPYDVFLHDYQEYTALQTECLMLRVVDFKKAGGLREETSSYAQAALDLCYNIREQGKKCVYITGVSFKYLRKAKEEKVQSKAFVKDVYYGNNGK